MKVRMLTAKAGLPNPAYGIHRTFSYAEGELVDVHDDLAKAWIASGHAEKLKERVKPAADKPLTVGELLNELPHKDAE